MEVIQARTGYLSHAVGFVSLTRVQIYYKDALGEYMK